MSALDAGRHLEVLVDVPLAGNRRGGAWNSLPLGFDGENKGRAFG